MLDFTFDQVEALVWKLYFSVLTIYVAVVWTVAIITLDDVFTWVIGGFFGWIALAILISIWLYA